MDFQKNEQVYFETIKCKDYSVYNLPYHKKRMSDTVGINFNLEEYIYPVNDHLLKCKVVYDQNGIKDILFDEYKPREIKSFKLIYDDEINYKYKSLNREKIDQLYSLKEDNDEIIIIRKGLVTDTSIANIAVYLDGQWYTPKTPLLEGTTKNRYLDEGFIKEKDISVSMLKKGTKIALMNAMIDFKEIENFEIN